MMDANAESVGEDEVQLLLAIRRSSPLETAMRMRALEEIARLLDTSALVELAAEVGQSSSRRSAGVIWI